MKQITGSPINIEEDILGRITLKNRNVFSRKDYILVAEDLSNIPSGYSATITNNHLSSNGCACVVDKQVLREFNEGDVVLISKSGEIIFLYEINSMHNAIFATERCNHRCIMCPQPPVESETDKTPFNMKLISLMDKHTREIGITGGEPTLIGDDLFVQLNKFRSTNQKQR